MGDSEWARQRGQAIASHAAALARRETAEADQAGAMLREFVRVVGERGIAPVALRARSYDGRHRYRLKVRGWYLRADESLAVGEGGEFYILSVPASLSNLVTGATMAASRPRLIIGEGGRDGERISLRALLDRLLAG
jgi:hypothetical protein